MVIPQASSSILSVPNLFGTRDWFHGRQFFHKLGWGRWFQHDSSALHLLCTFFILFLYQLYLRSSGIRSRRLGTPAVHVPNQIHHLHWWKYSCVLFFSWRHHHLPMIESWESFLTAPFSLLFTSLCSSIAW